MHARVCFGAAAKEEERKKKTATTKKSTCACCCTPPRVDAEHISGNPIRLRAVFLCKSHCSFVVVGCLCVFASWSLSWMVAYNNTLPQVTRVCEIEISTVIETVAISRWGSINHADTCTLPVL